MRIPIEWVLVLFYTGVSLVLVAMGTGFGRRHRMIGRIGVVCTLVACLTGVLTYMVFER